MFNFLSDIQFLFYCRGWQGLIAQGCHSSILIIDPKTAQTIQVLEKHKSNVVKVRVQCAFFHLVSPFLPTTNIYYLQYSNKYKTYFYAHISVRIYSHCNFFTNFSWQFTIQAQVALVASKFVLGSGVKSSFQVQQPVFRLYFTELYLVTPEYSPCLRTFCVAFAVCLRLSCQKTNLLPSRSPEDWAVIISKDLAIFFCVHVSHYLTSLICHSVTMMPHDGDVCFWRCGSYLVLGNHASGWIPCEIFYLRFFK